MDPLDIVNSALRDIGAVAATSMSDTAKNAAAAINAYEPCRDEVLRILMPPTCIKRAPLKGWHDQATPWAASHVYDLGDRVTNDTAKTYECVTAGKSAGSGGPTGTGTGIADGTVEWDYKEASTTANNWAWAATTVYSVGEIVSNDAGKVYVCITAGTSAGSGGPTGTSDDITDNTAHWKYYGTPISNRSLFLYAYIIPADSLRIIKLPKDGATSERDQGQQYKREGIVIYCDEDPTVAVYVKQETDPDQWGPIVQKVIALKIAAEIAYTVTAQKTVKADAEDRFASWFAVAKNTEAMEGQEAPEEDVRWEDV